MLYDKEIITIYRADNGGFVVKVKESSKDKTTDGPTVAGDDDTMHVFTTVAQTLKKVKEELAGEMGEDEKYKTSFKEAARQK